MRTAEEVKNFLKKRCTINPQGPKTYLYFYDKNKTGLEESLEFNRFDALINECLISLWNDEQIVNVIAFNEYFEPEKIPHLFFLTDKRRLIDCAEKSQSREGFIFTSVDYFPEATITELKYVDPNKCRVLEIAKFSAFGSKKPSTHGTLILNDEQNVTKVKLGVLTDILNSVIENIKAYDAAPEPKENKPKNNASDSVAEIRKLYEDGIITREEMLDLIKSAVSK